MLVLMPKYSHYQAIPEKMLHDVRGNINNTISKFLKHGDKVDVFIEDEFAVNYFKDRNLYTFTRDREIPTIESIGMYGDYIATVESLHPCANKYTLDFKKLEVPEIKLLYTNKDLYVKQYNSLYRNRAHDCISTLIRSDKKFAIVFTFRGKADNPIIPPSCENDGILYIYSDIETGVITGYYSGIWVSSDMIEKILGGIYYG